jgi:hypothetical protein
MDIIIAGGDDFPDELAGKWDTGGKEYWALTFEEDGNISSCAIGMGGIEVTPGKVSRFPARHGGEGIFTPGLWTVTYEAETRELSVEIVIEHFHLDMGGEQALEGRTTDLLAGPVSEDFTVWEADWFAKEKLVGFTPERKELPEVKEFEYRKKVIFKKVQTED